MARCRPCVTKGVLDAGRNPASLKKSLMKGYASLETWVPSWDTEAVEGTLPEGMHVKILVKMQQEGGGSRVMEVGCGRVLADTVRETLICSPSPDQAAQLRPTYVTPMERPSRMPLQ